jgi:flagellar biosynthetic protein FlhB
MADSAQDRTEDPTPRRRREAREKGQVAKSQDLTAAIGLITGLMLLFLFGNTFLFGMLTTVLEIGNKAPITVSELVVPVRRTGYQLARMLVPFLILLFLATIIGTILQFGVMFSSKTIKPDLGKLNPIKGVKRLFSLNAVMRFAMGLVKMGIVAGVAWYTLSGQIEPVLAAGALHVWGVLYAASELLFTLAIRLAIALLVLGLIDYIYQRYQHEKGLKMTKQEVKDEMKNMDGDPQVKKRQREAQMKVAMQRVDMDVPKSDVVVTNPTEYAVALKYDEDTMAAPLVLAKGKDLLALRIRQVAQKHGVPIVQRPPLARALYAEVDPGAEVPPELYKAVAEVLAYVYRLARRAAKAG